MHKIDSKDISVGSNATVREVIEKLNESAEKIVVVLNEKSQLLGTVTDGDVRRAMLEDNNLERSAQDIMNTKPITVTPDTSVSRIKTIITDKKIEHVPVVTNTEELLHVMRDISDKQSWDIEAIIMAGGLGKRLRPLTEETPKPLVRVGRKAIVEHLITLLAQHGIRDIKVSVRYLGGKIQSFLGDGERYGVQLSYMNEEEPLGTAGSLNMLPSPPQSDFLVLNGDIDTQINLTELVNHHKNANAIATVAAKNREMIIPYGVIFPQEDNRVVWDEKPRFSFLVSAGIYVLSPEILKYLPDAAEAIDMPQLLLKAQDDNQKINIFPAYEEWIDIGNHNDLHQARIIKESA